MPRRTDGPTKEELNQMERVTVLARRPKKHLVALIEELSGKPFGQFSQYTQAQLAAQYVTLQDDIRKRVMDEANRTGLQRELAPEVNETESEKPKRGRPKMQYTTEERTARIAELRRELYAAGTDKNAAKNIRAKLRNLGYRLSDERAKPAEATPATQTARR